MPKTYKRLREEINLDQKIEDMGRIWAPMNEKGKYEDKTGKKKKKLWSEIRREAKGMAKLRKDRGLYWDSTGKEKFDKKTSLVTRKK